MHEQSIHNILLQRHPGAGNPKLVRDEIADACTTFVNSGLADANFITELCTDSEAKYWSHVSEALLAAYLRKAGIQPTPSHGGGPDFLVVENGQRIWIEVICPTPIGIPPDWLNRDLNSVVDFPHKQILLRWTSAIKEKVEKLIGSSDGKVKGYIDKGVVALDDAYVIAVNGRQLRGLFPILKGISGFPFAMEAVFAVGPRQISVSRETLKPIDSGHQHRPLILRPQRAPVPAYTFLDDKSKPISAIWAVDLEGTSALGNIEPMAVIHNPNAQTRISTGFLPAYDEYVAKPDGSDNFIVSRIDGRLRLSQ